MDDKYWTSPVTIDLPGMHNQWTITACSFALSCLEGIWPFPKSSKFHAALHCCRRALRNEESADAARNAFIDMAREADVLVCGTATIAPPDYKALMEAQAAKLYHSP